MELVEVLERTIEGLQSPTYSSTPPLKMWCKGQRREAYIGTSISSEAERGFHIFKYKTSARYYKRILENGNREWIPPQFRIYEIHKVKGYNVRAKGHVSGGFLGIYIAQEAELVK